MSPAPERQIFSLLDFPTIFPSSPCHLPTHPVSRPFFRYLQHVHVFGTPTGVARLLHPDLTPLRHFTTNGALFTPWWGPFTPWLSPVGRRGWFATALHRTIYWFLSSKTNYMIVTNHTGRHTVKVYASAEEMHWFCYDPDIWHLTLKTFSAVSTHDDYLWQGCHTKQQRLSEQFRWSCCICFSLTGQRSCSLRMELSAEWNIYIPSSQIQSSTENWSLRMCLLVTV